MCSRIGEPEAKPCPCVEAGRTTTTAHLPLRKPRSQDARSAAFSSVERLSGHKTWMHGEELIMRVVTSRFLAVTSFPLFRGLPHRLCSVSSPHCETQILLCVSLSGASVHPDSPQNRPLDSSIWHVRHTFLLPPLSALDPGPLCRREGVAGTKPSSPREASPTGQLLWRARQWLQSMFRQRLHQSFAMQASQDLGAPQRPW